MCMVLWDALLPEDGTEWTVTDSKLWNCHGNQANVLSSKTTNEKMQCLSIVKDKLMFEFLLKARLHAWRWNNVQQQSAMEMGLWTLQDQCGQSYPKVPRAKFACLRVPICSGLPPGVVSKLGCFPHFGIALFLHCWRWCPQWVLEASRNAVNPHGGTLRHYQFLQSISRQNSRWKAFSYTWMWRSLTCLLSQWG